MYKYKVVEIRESMGEIELRRICDGAIFYVSGIDTSAYRVGDVLQWTSNGVRTLILGYVQ